MGGERKAEKGVSRDSESETSDQFFTHHHFYTQFRLSKKLPSWRSRSMVAPSPLIGHDSLRENKNWRGLGTIEETARFVLIRRNLISTEWWWKKWNSEESGRGGARHPFKTISRRWRLSSYRPVRSWIIQSSNCRRVNGSRKGVYPSVRKSKSRRSSRVSWEINL